MQENSAFQHSFNFAQVAEVKLYYITNVKPSERPKVSTSQDAYNIFYHTWDRSTLEYTETFKVMLLNQANRVLGVLTVSSGGISSTLVDIRVIFQGALLANSSGIILGHSHPSGNRKPSEQDIRITKSIKEAGQLLNISLLDHIIITPEHSVYCSMADDGLL
jgi:DNA repair protein RadC